MDEIIYLLKSNNTVNSIGDPIKVLKKIKRSQEIPWKWFWREIRLR